MKEINSAYEIKSESVPETNRYWAMHIKLKVNHGVQDVSVNQQEKQMFKIAYD